MDLDIRLQALEARVRLLEDQLAIYQVMAAYGPAADAGATDQAVALWTDDGTYDRTHDPCSDAECDSTCDTHRNTAFEAVHDNIRDYVCSAERDAKRPRIGQDASRCPLIGEEEHPQHRAAPLRGREADDAA